MASPHVAVIAFPFASHALKLFRLARALAAAAPAATFSFLSDTNSLRQLGHAGELQGNLRFVEVRIPEEAAGEVPREQRAQLFMKSAEAGGIREALEAARTSAGGARVSCVLADVLMWMSAEEAAAVAAPWVPVWMGGPSTLLAHLRGDALRLDIGDEAASRADELLTSYPGLGSFRVRDLAMGTVCRFPNDPYISYFRRIAQTVAQTTTAVALDTIPGLPQEEVMAALALELPNILPVGPGHLLPGTDSPDTDDVPADTHGCLAWLDRHAARTVAYVSFGKVVEAGPEELRELAAGLEASGGPFLWSLQEKSWPELPPGFMERGAGLVVPWAPQVQVLRHAAVGAFVTHAGWASVQEAVCSGVPMACRPFRSDQMMNARSVHTWGIGATIEEPVTSGAVTRVVASLLNNEEGAGMRAKMEVLRGIADSAVAPGGGTRNNLDKLVKIICAV